MQSPPLTSLQKVQIFLSILRSSISSPSTSPIILPFLKISTTYHFPSLSLRILSQQPFSLSLSSLNLIARLTQLLFHIHHLLSTNTISTKREIYYKYLNLYKDRYQVLHEDIGIICDSIGMRRRDLGIVGSGKCVMSGNVVFRVEGRKEREKEEQQETLEISKSTTFHLPTLPSLDPLLLPSPSIIIIIQKQSSFLNLSSRSRNPSHLLLTSKGYPDYSTQHLLQSFIPFAPQFYYLGDFDPYGFDILLQYTLGGGNYNEQFGVRGIEWLDLEGLLGVEGIGVEVGKVEGEYLEMSGEDRGKLEEVLGERGLGNKGLEEEEEVEEEVKDVLEKLRRWREKIQRAGELGKKVEIEGYLKYVKQGVDVLEVMIENQLIV